MMTDGMKGMTFIWTKVHGGRNHAARVMKELERLNKELRMMEESQPDPSSPESEKLNGGRK